MLVINLMGEPSVGKSLNSAGLFYKLGVEGIRAEIVPEVAKGFAWETPKNEEGQALLHPIFGQQIYLLGEQNRGLERLKGQRDVAIMECPLILTAIYAPPNYLPSFEKLVLEQFNQYKNFNILLERNHGFDKDGRVHDENQAQEVRGKLTDFLHKHNIDYIKMKTHKELNEEIFDLLKSKGLI